jgi:hypothetical protein
MIRHVPVRHGYWFTVAILASAVGLLLVFDLALFLGWSHGGGNGGGSGGAVMPTPTPVTSYPLATPRPSAPMAVDVGPNADCSACHVSGGTISTKPIPLMAHPVEGWTNCTACHATGSLVDTAPGHSGIHREECLVCHTAPAADATAAPRPHHVVEGTACITCHGSTAPLPTDMTGRTNCWICHAGTEFESLFGTPQPSPGT